MFLEQIRLEFTAGAIYGFRSGRILPIAGDDSERIVEYLVTVYPFQHNGAISLFTALIAPLGSAAASTEAEDLGTALHLIALSTRRAPEDMIVVERSAAEVFNVVTVGADGDEYRYAAPTRRPISRETAETLLGGKISP